MRKVKYTGKADLDHLTGKWIPGAVAELNDEAAAALLRERGDMVDVTTNHDAKSPAELEAEAAAAEALATAKGAKPATTAKASAEKVK